MPARIILLGLLLAISACSVIDTPITVPKPPTNKMDTTIGSYGQGRESGLVLVTMEAEMHQSLVKGQPISSRSNAPSSLPIQYSAFLSNMSEQYGVTRVADWPLVSIGIHCLVFETNGRESTESIIAQLNADSRIETAQAMQMFDVQGESDYNDPFMPLQHGLRSMQAEHSHRWASGSGVTVAVIDTGMDIKHPDLSTRVDQIINVVDKDSNRFSSDIHGTAVAGIIAASADNETGIVGIAPSARILPIKACWQNSDIDDESAKCNSFTLAKALNLAIINEVDIINLSLAGPRDQLLERLVTAALKEDIVVIGALAEGKPAQFPTVVPGTIKVSTSGTRHSGALLAPGRKVLSTRPAESYEFYTGSSFSAAHIAGLAALVRELQPDFSSTDVLELLESTANPVTGDVNACQALAWLAGVNELQDSVCPIPAS